MNDLIAFLKDEQIAFIENESMAKHTTFKTGGDAKLMIAPQTEDALQKLLSHCHAADVPLFVLGNGSNLLVSDNGIARPVVAMTKGFDTLRYIGDGVIAVGAGVPLSKLCKFALEQSLTGLEFAYGIPGSVGGAIFMNAGAYGGEMKDVVCEVRHLTKQGKRGTLTGEALGFSYRHSAYKENGCIITGALLRLQPGESKEIEEKMRELLQRRKDKQPLEFPSAGSVFKRPEGYFAGALIEQSGLKGKRIGGAAVSEKHAGFIVNTGGATTADVLALIADCKETVKAQFGVELETEIQMV